MSFHTEAQLKLALDDIRGGVTRAELWVMLGWQDIRQKFRRSLLGPFWVTISTAIMLVALGFVYATIFRMDLKDYFPFLAAGIVTWTLLTGLIGDGCYTFIGYEPLIRQIRLPFTVHACRVVWRNFLVFLHNFLIIVVVMFIFNKMPSIASILYLAGGVVVLLLNGVWIALLFGLICARFRDVPPIVTSLLQLVFFITPIIWHPSLLAGRQRVIDFNPFHHFIELLRAPMLGNATPATTLWAVLAITLAGWGITFLVFLRYRRRITYWL
jgi:ABC-type polysaccharide/polyol phosphate export permease